MAHRPNGSPTCALGWRRRHQRATAATQAARRTPIRVTGQNLRRQPTHPLTKKDGRRQDVRQLPEVKLPGAYKPDPGQQSTDDSTLDGRAPFPDGYNFRGIVHVVIPRKDHFPKAGAHKPTHEDGRCHIPNQLGLVPVPGQQPGTVPRSHQEGKGREDLPDAPPGSTIHTGAPHTFAPPASKQKSNTDLYPAGLNAIPPGRLLYHPNVMKVWRPRAGRRPLLVRGCEPRRVPGFTVFSQSPGRVGTGSPWTAGTHRGPGEAVLGGKP